MYTDLCYEILLYTKFRNIFTFTSLTNDYRKILKRYKFNDRTYAIKKDGNIVANLININKVNFNYTNINNSDIQGFENLTKITLKLNSESNNII